MLSVYLTYLKIIPSQETDNTESNFFFAIFLQNYQSFPDEEVCITSIYFSILYF